MSWIRNHFHEFVFPAFMAAEKRSDEIGAPFHVDASEHAPKHLSTELRKLWTLCKEHNVTWAYDTREADWGAGSSLFRSKAKVHADLLRDTLNSAIVTMKAEKCPKLFLGGRDVWLFAVLCERQRIPYLFVPELSRRVADFPGVKAFLIGKGFKGDELFLDTGFVGSIPRNMGKWFGTTFKFRLMSQDRQALTHEEMSSTSGLWSIKDAIVQQTNKVSGFTHSFRSDRYPYLLPKKLAHPKQLFPHRKLARSEALETEYLAKYWKTGTVDFKNYDEFLEEKGKVVQFFATRENIQRAALATSEIWWGHPFRLAS